MFIEVAFNNTRLSLAATVVMNSSDSSEDSDEAVAKVLSDCDAASLVNFIQNAIVMRHGISILLHFTVT
jgi:hypothetical protein